MQRVTEKYKYLEAKSIVKNKEDWSACRVLKAENFINEYLKNK